MATVRKLLEKNKELLHKEDENGWQAIHEAIRGAHTEIVKFLVEQGAQLNHKVHRGGSTLWLAKEHLPNNHEIVRFLMSSGAPVDHL